MYTFAYFRQTDPDCQSKVNSSRVNLHNKR